MESSKNYVIGSYKIYLNKGKYTYVHINVGLYTNRNDMSDKEKKAQELYEQKSYGVSFGEEQFYRNQHEVYNYLVNEGDRMELDTIKISNGVYHDFQYVEAVKDIGIRNNIRVCVEKSKSSKRKILVY